MLRAFRIEARAIKFKSELSSVITTGNTNPATATFI